MFLGPAADADIPGAAAILNAHGNGWSYEDTQLGERFIARDGEAVVGFLRLIDTPEGVYVADVIVHPEHRGGGIGSDLMRAAMATRSGPFFLVCHPERLDFYDRLGFNPGDRSTWPLPIVEVSKAEDDWDSSHEHLHHYMRHGVDTP